MAVAFARTRQVALTLSPATAADVMVPNPVSLRADASIREALALLTDKGFGAAPVIDDAGRPVGVLSRGDLLIHEREHTHYIPNRPSFFYDEHVGHLPTGFEEEDVDPTSVRDVMTPAIFSVAPDTPITKVVREMVSLHVHRLFVVDDAGTLIGVISTMDLLKRLQPAE